MRRLVSILLFAFLLIPQAASAATPEETVQTAWRLLDYVAVDYPGAVQSGRVVSQAEYSEMREFTATVERQLALLPATRARATLADAARDLRAAVDTKAEPAEVAMRARALGSSLLQAYPVPLAPPGLPDLQRGAALYAQSCAACHGVSGHGDGPDARGLDPAPVNFTDRVRADERSPFALEQVINQGLDGTAMPSFAQLSVQDRWALAFYVGTFAYPQAGAAEGRRIWEADAELRGRVPDLAALAGLTPSALAERIGPQRAASVIAYLRSNPQAVQPAPGAGSLSLTRSRLAESLLAYRAGNHDDASRLALSAYLDGFEPVEPLISSRDQGLMQRIEAGMGDLRAAIGSRRPAEEVEAKARALDTLFADAEAVLSPQAGSAAATFVSALTILLREGVEALLVVIAMIAFLRKAGRTEALPFVHGGWLSALAFGVVTWFIATSLIGVSGASRELTEGVGGIFSALVLVFVGIWMHGKAQANAWQQYVRQKMDRALSRGSGWFLFGLAFIVVYREVFETILFYAAMWGDSPAAVLGGVAVGAGLLGIIALVMLRFSAKLPITQFFRYSSILMAILAVVLVGKGLGAIQEAGLIGVTAVTGAPRIDVLGVEPSIEVMSGQLLVLFALGFGFWMNRRRISR